MPVTEDHEYRTLCDFINIEMASFSGEILDLLRELRETGRHVRFEGSIYSLAAERERTLIYADSGTDLQWCRIPAQELMRLLEEWKEKRAELKE